MASKLFDRVLDEGLSVLDLEATGIYLCDSEPTDYADATTAPGTGSMLGSKVFGAGAVFGAPAARAPNGRKVTSAPVTDGTIGTSGIATHWAVCDTVNARILARGTLSASQSVTSGNTFSLPALEIAIPAE